MGLADLHIHTTYSFDGTSSVSAVLKYAAHYTPLDVIAITDHDRIDGALKALDMAPSYGIEVIPGIEVTTEEGHVLALFVSQVIPPGLSLERTVLRTLELGGLCIIPHPMMDNRMGVNPHAMSRALQNPCVAAGLIGFEVFNAGLAGAQRDVCAHILSKRLPLAQVGCSDSHVDWMIGLGATEFPGESAAELRQALISRQVKARISRQMNWGDFTLRYVPRLVLRYAGWVSWNKEPSEPLRLAWLGQRLRALRA